jgi:hypothetical protein
MSKLSKLVIGGVLLAMTASALPAQATVITTTNQEVIGVKIADRGHGYNRHGNDDYEDRYEHSRGVRRGWYKNKKKKHHNKYYSNSANTRYGTPVIYTPQAQPQVIYVPQQQTCINTRFGRKCQ